MREDSDGFRNILRRSEPSVGVFLGGDFDHLFVAGNFAKGGSIGNTCKNRVRRGSKRCEFQLQWEGTTMGQFGEFFKAKRMALGKTLRQFCLENELDPGNILIRKIKGHKD